MWKNAFISFLRSYAVKAMTGLAGIKLVLAKYVAKHGLKYASILYDKICSEITYRWGKAKNEKAKEADEKAKEKYEETLKDGVSEEQQQDAVTDLLNGNRKL